MAINFILLTSDSQELYKWVFAALSKLVVNTTVKETRIWIMEGKLVRSFITR